jgi:hypothetical protein
VTTLFTIPPNEFNAGTVDSGSLAVPTSVTKMLLRVQQINWPHTGGPAFSMKLDYTLDAGAHWTELCTNGYNDVPVPASTGHPANELWVRANIPGAGSSNRRVRASWTFQKTLTVSGVVEGT